MLIHLNQHNDLIPRALSACQLSVLAQKSDCSLQEIEKVNQYFYRKHNFSHLLSYSKYIPTLDTNQCIIYSNNLTALSFKSSLYSLSTNSTQEIAIATPNGIKNIITLDSRKQNPHLTNCIYNPFVTKTSPFPISEIFIPLTPSQF